MAVKSAQGAEEMDWREYDRAYVASVGVADDDVEEAAAVLGHTRTAALWRWPIAESLAALRALAAAGVPLGVVSNASGQIERVLRRSGGLPGRRRAPGSRCAASSTATSSASPSPTRRSSTTPTPHFAGIDRGRIAYVGDSVTMDVGGATAAGLHPILLDPYDDHPDADFERIRSLGRPALT